MGTDTGDKFSRISVFLGALAALIAAMMPLSSYINGKYSLEVEREKFLTQMRLGYLDRALDPTKDANYRESIIRYLLDSIEPSDPLYKWAYNQVRVAEEIRNLETQISALDVKFSKATNELEVEQKGRDRERANASARERELRAQIEDAKSSRSRLEAALREAEAKIGRPPAITADIAASPATEVSLDTGADPSAGAPEVALNQFLSNAKSGKRLICAAEVHTSCGSCSGVGGGVCCVSC